MSRWTIPLAVMGAMAAFVLLPPLVIVIYALIMGSLPR
jgi:hypothetical protein